ncbi:helix-turn-helix domain-containing protein [Roseibium sp.]|uniref:helix-turn-helix domain-containing protein n=1 Tax=Roseibium sp. TaxID=1936156 RepID=UPI003A9701AE
MATNTSIPRYHLYGEGDPAEDFDFFHIETIRTRSAPLGWALEPHSHVHLFQVLMVTAGGGRLVGDQGESKLRPGMVALNPAGAMHGWTFSPDTEGYVVSFTHDYLGGHGADCSDAEKTALRTVSNLVFQPDSDESRRLAMYLAEMAVEFDNGRRRREVFRPLLALVLVHLFARKPDGAELDRTPGFSLFQFRSLVEENFRGERSPEFYAEQMGLTTQRLNRFCRLFTERTAAQTIRDRVMLEARRLLAFSDLSISQISYDLGYEDPAYFSRVFRKEVGESPQEFRSSQISD